MEDIKRNNSNGLIAIVLIAIGGIWLLRQLGVYSWFPGFHLHEVLSPFRHAFRGFWNLIFSWQIILIIIGLALMTTRNSTSGLILIIIGGLFLLPKIFLLPGITVAFIFPAILIGIGVALIVKII